MTAVALKERGNSTAGARWALAALSVFAAVWCVGCGSSMGPGASQVAAAIENASTECRLERESRLALGGLKMSAVKALVKVSGETEGAEILRSIDRVEIATYRVPRGHSCGEIFRAASLDSELAARGWWRMVSERDGTDASWVYAHGDREGDLDGLFVVVLDGRELEVVRLEGRIDRVMAEAVKTDSGVAEDVVAQLR
jgi:hypothetical protein